MRYTILLSFLIIGFSQLASGQDSPTLSDKAQISIITMGPSTDELYAAFGHNAIRVYDAANNIDWAYNYGTFDFDQPNFYLNFAKGNLLYKLAVQDYQRLKDIYIYYNRFIHEQVLEISQGQKQVIFDYLQNNALPENATYNYDYFYDNCATRIRDVIVETLGFDVRFESSHITKQMTIRELTDVYLYPNHPWGDLAIDFCLGLPMDKEMAPIEYMYIPDYIEAGFNNAWLKSGQGERYLTSPTRTIYASRPMEVSRTFFTPTVVFLILFIATVAITWWHRKKNKRGRYFDLSLFILVGFLGIFLALLWFATDHKAAAQNMNLIWAFPLHFIAAFALLRKNISPNWIKYFRITAIVLLLLLITWPLLPQMLHTSLMFVSAMIGVRAAYIGWGKPYSRYSSASE